VNTNSPQRNESNEPSLLLQAFFSPPKKKNRPEEIGPPDDTYLSILVVGVAFTLEPSAP
jgi:hypothetical protein